MKCPKCGNDQKYKYGMTCASCGRQFILDPKSGAKIGDARMAFYVRKASANDTVYFTRNQLYMVHAARHIRGAKTAMVIAFVVMALGLILGIFAPALFFFAFVAAIFGFVNWNKLNSVPDEALFDEALNRFKRAEPIPRLIDEPTLNKEPPPPPTDDVYDYGVEAVLITDQRLMVDLLVKNGWHMENKTLVISEDGYPLYLREKAVQLLREQGELKVYLLHDATERGEGMADRLRRVGKLPIEGHEVVDLGLSRDDAAKMKRFRNVGRRYDGQIPLDMVGYGMLAGGLGVALTGGLVFADMLDETQRSTEGMLSMGVGFG